MSAKPVIEPVTSKAALKRFIQLPKRLHRSDAHYIAPLDMERVDALWPGKNPFFDHAEHAYWLAVKDGRDVGRISAQIDKTALAIRPDATGHFGMIAAEDDPQVFGALLQTAEEWLRARGMGRIQGPFNLNINEEIGLLVDGFDTPPMLLMGHDRPYAGPRIEEQGYTKAKDVFAYIVDTKNELPQSVRRLVNRPLPKGLTVRPMNMKIYDTEIRAVTEIFNEAWADNWGFVPLSEVETDHLAKSLKPILNPKLVWFVEMDGAPAGFIVCLPNLNEAIRDLDGHLLPFGWAKLLWRLKLAGVKTARVPLFGVKRKYASGVIGAVLPFLLIEKIKIEGRKLGFEQVELSWILEDNMAMRRVNEAAGSQIYKTYRIYEKALS